MQDCIVIPGVFASVGDNVNAAMRTLPCLVCRVVEVELDGTVGSRLSAMRWFVGASFRVADMLSGVMGCLLGCRRSPVEYGCSSQTCQAYSCPVSDISGRLRRICETPVLHAASLLIPRSRVVRAFVAGPVFAVTKC